MRERHHMRTHARPVEGGKDRIGARTDLLRRSQAGELPIEHRQQPCQAHLVSGAIAADRIEANRDQLTDLAWMPSRIARTSSIGRPAGSGMSQSSTIVGT